MTQTQTPKLSKRQLEKKHKDAFDYLDDHYAYFLTNIVRVGRPVWTTSIPTAAVAIKDVKGKLPDFAAGDALDFEYIFNPDFAASLDNEKLAFVLAHESMHILLNHLKLVGQFLDKDRYEEIMKKIRSEKKLDRQDIKDSIKFQQIAVKFNIAADCVINDYLAQAGLPVWEQACRGQNFIGEDAAFMTVADVYERLPDQPRNGKGEGDEESEAGQLGKGDGRGDGAIDSHDWMFDPDFADKVADAIDEMNEQIEAAGGIPGDLEDKRDEEDGKTTSAQDSLQKSMRAGSEEGNMREFQSQGGLELAWVKLLKDVDPNMFKEPGMAPPPRPAWHKRPRKLGAHSFRDVNLPVYRQDTRREKRNNEKPAIVLALDHSGSIGPRDADRFMTLALSIPRDRIKLFCCTFTTHYREVDLDNPMGGGSGGTDFNAIASFIDAKVIPELNGKYPKAVVVITDGCAPFTNRPTPEQAEAWHWLMSPYDSSGGYYDAVNTIGRKANLSEYIA